MKIRDALRHGAQRLSTSEETPEHTARRLLAHVLGQAESWLYAHDDEDLSAEMLNRYEALLERAADGEPLAYLLGQQPFRTLTLKVTPDVLIPRPETEFLVEQALQHGDRLTTDRRNTGALAPDCAKMGETPSQCAQTASETVHDSAAACAEKIDPAKSGETPLRAVDLGTGSGAIALSLKAERPHWAVTATDRSQAALKVAQENAARHGLNIDFRHGSWFAPLQGERFDLIVSNPPYVAPGDPHLAGGIRFEPQNALVADNAGLADLFHLIDQAPDFLYPGGWLLLEHGYNQADAVCARLRARGFSAVQWHPDPFGNPRVSLGQWLP